jgi:hypothetical protein
MAPDSIFMFFHDVPPELGLFFQPKWSLRAPREQWGLHAPLTRAKNGAFARRVARPRLGVP